MNEKTQLEKVAGHPSVGLVSNALGLAAAAGCAINPLLLLVPPLVQTLAANRQTERVEKTLQELAAFAESHPVQVQMVTDSQLHLLNGVIATVLNTIDEQKMQMLKRIFKGATLNPTASEGASDALCRVIRDISAAEAKFVLNNFQFANLFLDEQEAVQPNTRAVSPSSPDAILFTGLVSLGLLVTSVDTWDVQLYGWSPLVAKLIALMKK